MVILPEAILLRVAKEFQGNLRRTRFRARPKPCREVVLGRRRTDAFLGDTILLPFPSRLLVVVVDR